MFNTSIHHLMIALSVTSLLSTVGFAENFPSLESDPSLAPKKPVVLEGKAITLQEAIDQETSVDWYGWYLACREYLKVTGGLSCSEGTPIVFHKNGLIQAQSNNFRCKQSVQFKRYRLPENTQLSQLILPVRSNVKPPAPRQELLNRINKAEQRYR